MPAVRIMPTQESADLLELVRSIADKELRPMVDQAERAHTFHRGAYMALGRAGLLGLPYPTNTAVAGSLMRSTCRLSRRSLQPGRLSGLEPACTC